MDPAQTAPTLIWIYTVEEASHILADDKRIKLFCDVRFKG